MVWSMRHKEHSKVTIASDEAKEEETIQYLVLPASTEAAVIYFHLNGTSMLREV